MTHCKICGREVNKTTEKNGHDVFHCPACNFFFSNAHATPEYYTQKYWNIEDAGWKERNTESNFKIHLDSILHYNPGAKKILDFGCGYGKFTVYLREKDTTPMEATPSRTYQKATTLHLTTPPGYTSTTQSQ